MITWKDFLIDDDFGAVLFIQNECKIEVCGGDVHRSGTDVTEDIQIQETGRSQWPARMVGKTSLDSNTIGMEADRAEDAKYPSHSRRVGA